MSERPTNHTVLQRIRVKNIRSIYDHMYATETVDEQHQRRLQQQRLVLSASSNGGLLNPAGAGVSDGVRPEAEVGFLKEWLLVHLDLIQQQNEDILLKDTVILTLQQENALLKQRLHNFECGNLVTATSATPLDSASVATLTSIPSVCVASVAAAVEYSPESIDAPDEGDDMTAGEPNLNSGTVAPITAPAQLKSDNSRICSSTPAELAVADSAAEPGLPERRCNAIEDSVVIVIDDDPDPVDLTQEQGNKDNTSTNKQPSPTIHTTTIVESEGSPSRLHTPPIVFLTTGSLEAMHAEALKNLARTSATIRRRKRQCSGGSSLSNNESLSAEVGGEREGGAQVVVYGRRKARGKRKRMNGEILTYPAEYVTRVGEFNVDILRQQELAEEVIKAVNLEVPHWRVKVYADSYHLEGTENLDDEVFLKRHARLENDERRRKRWDVQRIREQRLIDKLKQRQSKTKTATTTSTPQHDNHPAPLTNGLDSACPLSATKDTVHHTLNNTSTYTDCCHTDTLWPEAAYDLQLIEVTDRLPVGAFGTPLPAIVPSEFRLPWLNLNLNLGSSSGGCGGGGGGSEVELVGSKGGGGEEQPRVELGRKSGGGVGGKVTTVLKRRSGRR